MSKDYVVVTCISSFRMRYVMHKDDLQKLNPNKVVDPIEWANDTVAMEQCEDFSQEWMGEYISDAYLVSEEEMLELFDRDNDYLKGWTREQKLNLVRTSLKKKDEYVDQIAKENPTDLEGRPIGESYRAGPPKQSNLNQELFDKLAREAGY